RRSRALAAPPWPMHVPCSGLRAAAAGNRGLEDGVPGRGIRLAGLVAAAMGVDRRADRPAIRAQLPGRLSGEGLDTSGSTRTVLRTPAMDHARMAGNPLPTRGAGNRRQWHAAPASSAAFTATGERALFRLVAAGYAR